jgi:hypothetical protein
MISIPKLKSLEVIFMKHVLLGMEPTQHLDSLTSDHSTKQLVQNKW